MSVILGHYRRRHRRGAGRPARLMGQRLAEDFQCAPLGSVPIEAEQFPLPGNGVGLRDGVRFGTVEVPVLVHKLALLRRPDPANGANPFAAGVQTDRSIAMESTLDEAQGVGRVLRGCCHARILYRNKEGNTGISKKEPSFSFENEGFL